MLPLEIHYVAEIRYQEHVAAARPPNRDRAIATPLSRFQSSRRPPSPSVLAALRGWLIARLSTALVPHAPPRRA
jgi:hypothetical protein